MTSEFAERLVWTIEYIIHNPEKLSGITEIEQETPYLDFVQFGKGIGDEALLE